ncbi:MAG: hypothetical protein JW819_08680 [Candidatus Krumholzibacteriota bacterium]|nr:hypothetical protein [Candidatus Krumholzibacteriota bacterium]
MMNPDASRRIPMRIMILTAALAVATQAQAQIVDGRPPAGSVRFIQTYWKQGLDPSDLTTTQTASLLTGYVPVRPGSELRVLIAAGATHLDAGSCDYDLSGLADVRLLYSHVVRDGRVLLNFGVNLPTGPTELDVEDYFVMDVLTREFLLFPLRRLGEGLGVSVAGSWATVSGPYRLGLSAGYRVTGSYEEYDGMGSYDPGNQLSLQVDIQRSIREIALDATVEFATHGVDRLHGDRIYSQGKQLSFSVDALLDRSAYAAKARLSYVARGRSEAFDQEEELLYRLKYYGDQFYLAGQITWQNRPPWQFGPRFLLQINEGSEVRHGPSRVLGVGGQVARQFDNGLFLTLESILLNGSADDGDIDLFGFQCGLMLARAF